MHGTRNGLKPVANGIVHPGMPVHFDPPCLNIYCGGVIGLRDFKLGGVIQKSYGFFFVGPVSMETRLTFEPKAFVKFTKILTSPREQIFSNASYFILEPTHGASNPMD